MATPGGLTDHTQEKDHKKHPPPNDVSGHLTTSGRQKGEPGGGGSMNQHSGTRCITLSIVEVKGSTNERF